MCGIVAFFGRQDGVGRVIEALHLLEYRAPDSTGLAAVGEAGRWQVRRSVGGPGNLARRLASEPLYTLDPVEDQAVEGLLRRQGLSLTPDALRDLTSQPLEALFAIPGLRVGLGDRGCQAPLDGGDCRARFSARTCQALEAGQGLASPDFSRDPVRHAFRLLAGHVAGPAAMDADLRARLDRALAGRLPADAYPGWLEAWQDEVAVNTPGQAFSVAVRHFQETFPGLAGHLAEADWERVGGLTARAMAQVVIGHGRWATVGAATLENAHPFLDRSRTRVVCENGSHNPSLLLGLRDAQIAWWHERGLPAGELVHRSQNTTEVIAFEWERAHTELDTGALLPDERAWLERLAANGVLEPEEQALRLTLRRLREGNAHACAFASHRLPGRLYISSHDKPIALAWHALPGRQGESVREIMVASDVNAALMLWPGAEVDTAAARLTALEARVREGSLLPEEAEAQREELLAPFRVQVIFLDADLFRGRELLACLSNRVVDGRVETAVQVTRYDGTPVDAAPQPVHLNPAMVGKRGFPTYTESHIDEIPAVLDEIVRAYLPAGRVDLASGWQAGEPLRPGLNLPAIRARFGPRLERLRRVLLIGEGSSWRLALAAAPLLRHLMPAVETAVYRPVEMLNLGTEPDPSGDLAVAISWSGTTDSLLKVDRWLEELDVLRLGVTGRPQSDLGRRAARSAGTLDAHTGVEVSVATVKGYAGLLLVCDLVALQLADLAAGSGDEYPHALVEALAWGIPAQARALLDDLDRRARIRKTARRCGGYNKVVVVGDSPVDVEAELKIEELAQVVAVALDLSSDSLQPLMERSARAAADSQRILFVVNATRPEAIADARLLLARLTELRVFGLLHTSFPELAALWEADPGVEVFLSPRVDALVQPLIDSLFFFDFAVGLAYARGLGPDDIDRPRNLAKSITITGAERRAEVEARDELQTITLEEFGQRHQAGGAWDVPAEDLSLALGSALAVLTKPLPPWLKLETISQVVMLAGTEAAENGAAMAAGTWRDLLGVGASVYRRFLPDQDLGPGLPPDRVVFHLQQAGGVLALGLDGQLSLPAGLSPLQLELWTAMYLTGLAVRQGRERGLKVTSWERGLTCMPGLLAGQRDDPDLIAAARATLQPYTRRGYDKFQVIGGGQDYLGALSIARSLRERGFLAEAQYTDSAWHGPLAAVGGPDAEHDALVVILATDPLFQPAALVDTQVYRTRHAPVLLVVPTGNQDLPVVRGVDASAVLAVPAAPRFFTPLVNAVLGDLLAGTMDRLWS